MVIFTRNVEENWVECGVWSGGGAQIRAFGCRDVPQDVFWERCGSVSGDSGGSSLVDVVKALGLCDGRCVASSSRRRV
jgi:hypothetical protein